MQSGSVAEKVNEIAEQAAIDHGVELVHAELAGPEGHPIVRVFIDKPGGVTHHDCSDVSTQIGTVLDVEDRKVTSKRFATAPENPAGPRCARR